MGVVATTLGLNLKLVLPEKATVYFFCLSKMGLPLFIRIDFLNKLVGRLKNIRLLSFDLVKEYDQFVVMFWRFSKSSTMCLGDRIKKGYLNLPTLYTVISGVFDILRIQEISAGIVLD